TRGHWLRQDLAQFFPLGEGAPVPASAAWREDQGQRDSAPSFNGFLAGLDRVVEAASRSADRCRKGAPLRLPRSTKEWLAGKKLPEIFERHFLKRAGISRDSDAKGGPRKADGPYIRFAVAALQELKITNGGVPYSGETIARALTDVRAGRVRRKARA